MQAGRQNAQQDNLTTQGQITDRYTAAVDQLGSNTPDVRSGGIYALERIMRDSPADEPTIVEVLCAFVRYRQSVTPKPAPQPVAQPLPTDVEAALHVLGRRATVYNGAAVDEDLSHADFSGFDLKGTSLIGADLTGANFDGADLTGMSLARAFLDYANLTDARLVFTILSGAHLTHANLSGAFLINASLDGADLTDANLSGANLSGAQAGDTLLCSGSTPLAPRLGYGCDVY